MRRAFSRRSVRRSAFVVLLEQWFRIHNLRLPSRKAPHRAMPLDDVENGMNSSIKNKNNVTFQEEAGHGPHRLPSSRSSTASLPKFFGLAVPLGGTEVEIRNELPGVAIADGTPAQIVKTEPASVV